MYSFSSSTTLSCQEHSTQSSLSMSKNKSIDESSGESPGEEMPKMIVSLSDSFHNCNHFFTRMSSLSSSCSKKRQFSFISLEGDYPASDFEEEDSVSEKIHVKKTRKTSSSSTDARYKTVGFYQDTSLEQVKPIKSFRDPAVANTEELWWTRKELNQIQMQGRMDQATDLDVQDFLQSYHQAHCQVLKNESNSLPPDVHNGIKEGLRGMENFSPLQLTRRRQLKKFIKSVVDSPKEKVAETSLQWSEPAQRWSALLGKADHQAATDAK